MSNFETSTLQKGSGTTFLDHLQTFGHIGHDPTIGQPLASKDNGFNLVVNKLNKKTKLGLHLTSKQMKAALTSVINEQLFRFPKEDEDIREGEDINPITNSDIINNYIPVPPLETPINTSSLQKTSNSWNMNPNSHQKTSKSALLPTTYAELCEAKAYCD
ncbi:hypothetical protein PPACK8108_LOCUS16597 [Phakopsora pachyrhizi]|uniref:Uncharacterized protein n=1 Tax=Phakopsora pachyrhizi TaxID=170000 RepID=A0AAV0B9L1_PHAPC|nr:hypothetical protein PPACK8108_LOCUS16597 [Phakopsora pachyrhizi]